MKIINFLIFRTYWRYMQHQMKKRYGSVANYIRQNPKTYWDKFAPIYDKVKEVGEPRRWLLDRIREAKPESILEVGCGTGRILRRLKKDGVRICGVDISPKMIDEARKLPELKYADLRVASAVDMPSPPFDLVFTAGTLMYLSKEDIIAFLKQIGSCVMLLEGLQGIWGGSLLEFCKDILMREGFEISEIKTFRETNIFFMEARSKRL